MLEFLAMGGHAFYVWGSWGGGAALLLVELWVLGRARRARIRHLKRAEAVENP